ncbi:fungal-specific transcription factor domain-containing protein [Gongronella butleri]|nr:fungal-specific transcription factor domain-containing protein [Gongronella butleri]
MDDSFPSTEYTATGEKRRRLAQACLTCRRKKTKCDGVKPVCNNCSRLHQECNYALSSRKRKVARQGHIEVLEARLAKMETLLKQQNGPSQGGHTTATTGKAGAPSILATAAEKRAAYPIDLNNLTMVRNTDPSLPPMSLVECLTEGGSAQYVIDMDRRLLPTRDIQERLVRRYLDRLYGCAPFFYPEDILDLDRCPTVIIMAITTATIKYIQDDDNNEDLPPWLAGEKYAIHIRQRLNDILDVPSIMHIQVLMLLIMHEFGCARGARSWMYCGMACRMAQELNLHAEPKVKKGEVISIELWRKHELSRRVFWSIYMFDRFGGASTARPVMFDDNDIDVHLPVEAEDMEQDEFYSESLDGSTLATYQVVQRDEHGAPMKIKLVDRTPQDPVHRARCNLGWITHMLRITYLFNKVATFVNRTMVRENTPLAPFDMESPDYINLSAELDRWMEQLPLNMRNTPANLERYRSEMSRDTHRFLLSHILYNSLVVFLNRPALALTSGIKTMNKLPQPIRDAIHLGLEKCQAASDNVSVMLDDINTHVKQVFPFLSYLTYSTATVVVHTIFNGRPHEAKKAAQALKSHCLFLQNMRKYYAMADKLFFMIRDFYAIHKNQLVMSDIDNDSASKLPNSPAHKKVVSPDAKHEESPRRSSAQTFPSTEATLGTSVSNSSIASSSSPSSTSASSSTPQMSARSLDELLGSIDNTFTQLLDQSWSSIGTAAEPTSTMFATMPAFPSINASSHHQNGNPADPSMVLGANHTFPGVTNANTGSIIPQWPFPTSNADFDL